ncbi:unnamed protein product [Cylicocyclus nassatus]|uniref:Domain of unknown function DB domain-containing protein n=1 Tax=Cylicocyclus nassatus TaxID=53992 RepID=A0AA36H5Z8_CYLNA|nr:unnamed protein product [Cylicocyclus nassatus]
MILRSFIALLATAQQITSQRMVLVEGSQPRRPSRMFRSQRRHDETKVYDDDSANHIIYAPLEGERVITKGIIYVNGKSKTDDQLYQTMLAGDSNKVTDVDPFFVTEPPRRTTLAIKNEILDSLDSYDQNDYVPSTSSQATTTTKYPLRLVTIPARTTTPLPPYKHTTRRPVARFMDSNATRAPVIDSEYASPALRFPAQPWQIPPFPPPLPPPDVLSPHQYPLIPPPNPFQPIVPARESDVVYPYVPIDKTSMKPPLSPTLGIYPTANNVRSNVLVHKSSPRQGSYVRNRDISAIPLPSSRGNAYVNVDGDLPKKTDPEIDFSLDSEPVTVTRDTVVFARPYATPRQIHIRSISEPYLEERGEQQSSEQLRLFARNHPNVLKSMTKQIAFKDNHMILPKSATTNVEIPSASIARTSLTPNEKLDLCCRKRRVNPGCQAMCNFEALNDRTLVSAFLTNICPGPQQRDAFDCASSKVDHSACCERAGLGTFLDGRCLPFCRTHDGSHPLNPLEFIPCLQVFEHIKSCYREYQTTHPNIFGD